ncbi:hypothetical protein B0H14DRAFT_3560642 [Mycena olivaceomarginata]|nr:hypothetical protein B0H14DRAFT_3560642 [Mycena olivaceomarginata]
MCAKLPENAPPEGIKLLCAAANRHGFACKSNRAMGNLIEGGNALIVKPQKSLNSLFSHAQKSVTCYEEQIECGKWTEDTQHYSEQFCLFEIVRNALIVKPQVTQLSWEAILPLWVERGHMERFDGDDDPPLRVPLPPQNSAPPSTPSLASLFGGVIEKPLTLTQRTQLFPRKVYTWSSLQLSTVIKSLTPGLRNVREMITTVNYACNISFFNHFAAAVRTTFLGNNT